MRNQPRLVASLAITAAACSSHSAEYEYVRVQHEEGFAMTAPITFTVRVRVDTLAKKVHWLQDARDARGVEARTITTYGGTSFSSCQVFDEANWSCDLRALDGTVVEQPEMKDGRLSRWYFTDTQRFERRRRSNSRDDE